MLPLLPATLSLPPVPHLPRPGARTCLQRGFTLLELLVVLLLIGVILSFASLSFGDGGREGRMATEARRFGALLELAGEESVLETRELGVQIYRGGYRFVTRMRNKWAPIEDELLRPRPISEELGLALFLEGLPVELSDRFPEGFTPQLVLTSSGERTPFELLVGGLDKRPPRYRIRGGPFGKLTIARQEGT